MNLEDMDGGDLAALAATAEADPDRLEEICLELAGRINRADLMIGILPLSATGVVVAGLSAAGRAGRARAWTGLGICYLGVDGDRLEPADWPSAFPFADDPGTQLGGALRCFAEAAALGDRDGAVLFTKAARHASPDAQRAALDLLRPFAGTDDEAAYQFGLVHEWLGDHAAALPHHEFSAAQGNADAAFELYVLYSTGTGVARDDTVANTWLVRAADLGQHRALYNVAAGHATGNGFPHDMARAAQYYERAADAGNPRAAATLGVMHLTGDGVAEDEAAAARWLDRAEHLGHPVDDWLDQLGLDRPQA